MNPDSPSTEQADRPNQGGPPQLSPDDPIAPVTHDAGGTYAEADYSVAAQRSKLHTEQYEPGPPTLRPDTPQRLSGFAEAQPYDPVGGQSTGK